MTVPVSTAAAALASLLTQVQAQVATDATASQVLVCIGEPGMDLPSDIIQLGTNIRRQVVPEAFMGGYQMAGPLKETYEIECTVSSWSGDPDPVAIVDRAYALAERMEAGTVWINKHAELAPNIPFGGAKQSGLGVELGEEGLHEFTQLQIINMAK